jgi:hypothetical protein
MTEKEIRRVSVQIFKITVVVISLKHAKNFKSITLLYVIYQNILKTISSNEKKLGY